MISDDHCDIGIIMFTGKSRYCSMRARSEAPSTVTSPAPAMPRARAATGSLSRGLGARH